MMIIEGLSKKDYRAELIRSIAKPDGTKNPLEIISSLTAQGADPCDLRRQALSYVAETAGPSSQWTRRTRDAFAEHDIWDVAAAGARMRTRGENNL